MIPFYIQKVEGQVNQEKQLFFTLQSLLLQRTIVVEQVVAMISLYLTSINYFCEIVGVVTNFAILSTQIIALCDKI